FMTAMSSLSRPSLMNISTRHFPTYRSNQSPPSNAPRCACGPRRWMRTCILPVARSRLLHVTGTLFAACATIELDEHSALIDARLICPRGAAASEEAPASGEDSRNRKLGIFLPRPRIGDRTIADDPICLGHGFPSLSTRCQHPFDARPTLPPKCQKVSR